MPSHISPDVILRAELLSARQIATILSVATTDVNWLIRSGALRGHRLPGGAWRRASRQALVRYILEQRIPLETLHLQGLRPEEVAELCAASSAAEAAR